MCTTFGGGPMTAESYPAFVNYLLGTFTYKSPAVLSTQIMDFLEKIPG